MADDPQLARLIREMGRVAGRLEEIDHRVDRAMQRIDAVERAALRAAERVDRADVEDRLDKVEKLAAVMADRAEQAEKAAVAGHPGYNELTKQERIALTAGAPIVLAALITALVEILKITGGT